MLLFFYYGRHDLGDEAGTHVRLSKKMCPRDAFLSVLFLQQPFSVGGLEQYA
jgi:hypothetical protein